MFKVDWTTLDQDEQKETARLILDDVQKGSDFLHKKKSHEFPKFERQELGLGAVLGYGSFCKVEEILCIRILSEESNSDIDENVKNDLTQGSQSSNKKHRSIKNADDVIYTKTYMQQQCLRENPQNSEEEARYAVKRIKSDLPMAEQMKGVIDLAIETQLLKALSHPNIIKMRAISTYDVLSSMFFIVLDRLYATLEDKIDSWIKEHEAITSRCFGCGKVQDVIEDLWIDQTVVSFDLSSAFTYLHENNIIYRDVKPNNIGFDVRGDVKLFDFGLSRELREFDKVGTDLYKLTGITGSRRYMAPEIVLCKPYGLSADVYSFAILMHEMFSLEIPFETYDIKDHMKKVVLNNVRPKIPNVWPGYLKSILHSGWSAITSDRPNFQRIKSLLGTDLNLRAGGGFLNRSNDLMERSRRSVHDFNQRNNLRRHHGSMDRSDHSMR